MECYEIGMLRNTEIDCSLIDLHLCDIQIHKYMATMPVLTLQICVCDLNPQLSELRMRSFCKRNRRIGILILVYQLCIIHIYIYVSRYTYPHLHIHLKPIYRSTNQHNKWDMMAPAKLAAAAAAFAWPGSWVATIIMPTDPSTVTIEPYVDS